MKKCSVSRQLLASFLFSFATTTLATSPLRASPPEHPPREHAGPSTIRAPDQDFRWSVTTFRSSRRGTDHQPSIESSDAYFRRIHNDPTARQERLHSIQQDIHANNIDHLTANLDDLHRANHLSDAEYQVGLNNLKAKYAGRELLKQGHAVTIGNTVHHPKEMDHHTVADGFKEKKTARILTLKVPEVRHDFHAMMLLHPPPKRPQRTDDSQDALHTASTAYPGQTTISKVKTENQSGHEHHAGHSATNHRKGKEPGAAQSGTGTVTMEKEHSWLVTSKKRVHGSSSGPKYHTEPVQQYREESKRRAAEDQLQGHANKLHGFIFTPHPVLHNPAYRERMLPSLLHGLEHHRDYTPQELSLVRHNMEQLTNSVDFMTKGGIVYFPDSIHHPHGTTKYDALFQRTTPKLVMSK